MTVSGSTNFELDVADYVEEAFERCGLEVRTGYDLKTAKRSMNLMFADWANRGLNQWTIAQKTSQWSMETEIMTLERLQLTFYRSLCAGMALITP
tara:strand:- start:3242 stop:3526 length:285 start_codon:yes stop_codon:yes gene_type:complete